MPTIDGIGGGKGKVGGRIQLDDVSVTRQPTSNTCVPASIDMLMEELAPGRKSTNIENLKMAPKGLHPTDAYGMIGENLEAAGMRMKRGELSNAIKTNRPFIAFVDDGHAVVVQEVRQINGVQHVLVRDPLRGAYLEPITNFDARLIREHPLVASPVVWGVPQ